MEQKREYFDISERIHLCRNITEKNVFGTEKGRFEISERIHLYRNIIAKKVFGSEK